MIERILLAVDDSPASFRAARLAIAIARAQQARLRVVSVVGDGEVDEAIRTAAEPTFLERRQAAAAGVLDRVSRLADRDGVDVETYKLQGRVAEHVLGQADRWHADMIVMGRSSTHRTGDPYVGSQTRHVLEFSDQPVLVVPSPRS
jgi:nucleotide-binding universal stress UspA family protein